MLKEEDITILGHETVFREDRTSNSGGIMIAVKGTIKTISMQIQHKKSHRSSIMGTDGQSKNHYTDRSNMRTTGECNTS